MSLSISAPLSVIALITMWNLTLQRKHLLMALLSLEAMILSIAALFSLYILMNNQNEMFFILLLLTFGACEASLGLACLVAMTRSFGSDHIKALTLNKC